MVHQIIAGVLARLSFLASQIKYIISDLKGHPGFDTGNLNLPLKMRHDRELILLAVACEAPAFCDEAAKKQDYDKDSVFDAIRIRGGGRGTLKHIGRLCDDIDVICAALNGSDWDDRWGEDVLRHVGKSVLDDKQQVRTAYYIFC